MDTEQTSLSGDTRCNDCRIYKFRGVYPKRPIGNLQLRVGTDISNIDGDQFPCS